jgi:LacI family transcriptional regulator
MPVRMKDIAEALGVSIVTVSKALRNHPDIAIETRDRILARVKELNYRPNLMARSLVTGHSELVGLVVPDLVHPFFSEIAKALSDTLRQKKFYLVVSSSDGDPTLEQAQIDHLLAYRLDALVVASCQLTSVNLKHVLQHGTPLILLDRSFPDLATHFVGADDHKIGVLATEHLIASGRTRIAHLRGPANSVAQQRLEGFTDTMRQHGLEVPPKYISAKPQDANQRKSGREAMKRLLALKPPPQAVFCFNDAIALGAIEAAGDAGIEVPRDIAIIGCGNYHFDDTLRVPLSSIEQGSAAMGRRLAELILKIVATKHTLPPTRTILKPELVIRQSSQTNPVKPTAESRE